MGVNIYRALSVRVKTVEQLEDIRREYLEKINRADRKKLEELFEFFAWKAFEEDRLRSILERFIKTFPKGKVPKRYVEVKAMRDRLYLLWSGLRDEVAKRLGVV